MSENFPNEEDIRSRLILPFIRDLGISENNLRLEKSFALRLGRTAVSVSQGHGRDKLGGRLDILIKNDDGSNLFIFELKADKHSITNDDVDQGISYARLLDQMAPFVIVSNGVETRIFDTITKEELTGKKLAEESQYWRSGCTNIGSDDIHLRYEALKHFISYSQENVRDFSLSHVNSNMRSLMGSAIDTQKKYIPELYQERDSIKDALDKFLDSDAVVFSLVGKSGAGKTNELCFHALQLCSENIVLFYSGVDLFMPLEHHIENDFGWNFSQDKNVFGIISRLNEIAAYSKTKVVIFIDAIDEVSTPDFEKNISDFSAHLANFNGSVKLILSCKEEEWDRFVSFRGNPSKLKNNLWIQSKDARESFYLSEFTGFEFENVKYKYQQFFLLSDEVLTKFSFEEKLPFMLRVASEVYRGNKVVDEELYTEDLIRKWLSAKFSLMQYPDQAKAELISLGREVYKNCLERTPHQRSYLTKESVHEPSNQPNFGHELIAHGVITKQVDENLNAFYSIYFGAVRDFVLSRWVLKLDAITSDDFKALLPNLLPHPILQSCLYWHLKWSPRLLSVYKDTLHGRAYEYLQSYIAISVNAFPQLSHWLVPSGAENLGVIYSTRKGWLTYALFDTSHDKYPKIFEASNDFNMRSINVLFGFHGGGNNFSNYDPKLAAAEEALERVKSLLAQGLLDITTSDILLKDSILALVRGNCHDLSYSPPREYLTYICPIDLIDLKKRIQIFYGIQHLNAQWSSEQIQAESEFVSYDETGNFRSINMPSEVLQNIKQKSIEMVESGHEFPKPDMLGIEEIYLLDFYVDKYAKRYRSIDFPVLPEPDRNSRGGSLINEKYYSDACLENLLNTFFMASKKSYFEVVDGNFLKIRTLLRNFQRFSNDSFLIMYERPPSKSWSLRMGKIKNIKYGDELYVTLISSGSDIASDKGLINEELVEFDWFTSTSLEVYIMSPLHSYPFVSSPGVGQRFRSDDHAFVRRNVYAMLEDDLNGVSASSLLCFLHVSFD